LVSLNTLKAASLGGLFLVDQNNPFATGRL